MKHAILIIAYHNIDYIKSVVKKFDSDFLIFIHWDQRKEISIQDKSELEANNNVVLFSQEFSVNWASFGIVRATLFLCKNAVKYQNVEYIHLISDSDLLVCDIMYLKSFFKENKGKNYIEYTKYPVANWNGGYDRVLYYHRLEKYNIRENKYDKKKYEKELSEQKKMSLKREYHELSFFGGSAWWSLTKDCVEYLVANEYLIEKIFIDTLFPDESFVQTILLNSKYANTIVNDNKRYISWGWRNNSNPAILDMSDFGKILNNKYIFARKIDPTISARLLDAVDSLIINQENRFIDIYNWNLNRIMLYIIERYQKLILRGGLYYGCVGTLIFLCLYQYIDRDINNSDLIKNLFNIVCEEFYESVDNSFETGKLGIAIALEFVAPYLWQLYNQELIEALNCINETIINNILNYAYGNMPLYASHVYNIYFTAREFGKRMNNADKSAKTYLNRHKKSVRSIVTVMHNQWNWSLGIKGVGGLGLSLLSNRFNKNEINWTFLLSEIREK